MAWGRDCGPCDRACWSFALFVCVGCGPTNPGSTSDAGADVDAAPAPVVQAIVAGSHHTCALVDGAVWCWGSNYYGELGDGSQSDRLTPARVVGLDHVTTLGATGATTCAVQDGAAWCWGGSNLGNGSSAGSNVPVQLPALSSGVTAIAGGASHACATTASGIECWGDNEYGQLGNGSTALCHPSSPYPCSLVPVQVANIGGGVQAVACGEWFTCAVVSGGVQCWGDDGFGQLGASATTTCFSEPCSLLPVQAGLSSGVTAIAAGADHVCAIVGGSVECWGADTVGNLGNGTKMGSSQSPVQVSLPAAAQAIASGAVAWHSCAIVGGAVWCWGDNQRGQLGNGTSSGPQNCDPSVDGGVACSPSPVQVGGIANATAITAGDAHTCAIVGVEVWCWGDNGYGALGDGSRTSSPVPVLVQRSW